MNYRFNGNIIQNGGGGGEGEDKKGRLILLQRSSGVSADHQYSLTVTASTKTLEVFPSPPPIAYPTPPQIDFPLQETGMLLTFGRISEEITARA